jgi:polar amino acid transport system ATP-binding protein
VIRLEEVTYVYPGGTVGLDGVSLELEPGGIRAVVGRSGSGKTTLLKCLGRFLEPASGRILIEGEELSQLEEVELRQRLGIVFQQLHLFPHLTVLENLTLAPVRVLQRERAAAQGEAMAALERFGMAELADSYPAQISGGQAQRVAIARALLMKPEYLLLDEPTSALDLRTARELGEWLLDLEGETTFIVVTHDALFVRQIAASAVLLEAGRVVASGAAAEVLERLESNDPGGSATDPPVDRNGGRSMGDSEETRSTGDSYNDRHTGSDNSSTSS